MDAQSIFDALGRASEIVQLFDQRRRKRRQLVSVTSRLCGNCTHWMKTTCVPEKVHKQFKSQSSLACSAFALSAGSANLAAKFTDEISDINAKLGPT